MDLERYCATAWGFCSQAPRREPPLVRTPSTGFVLRLTSRKGWVLRWLELDFGCDAGDPAEPAGDAPAACLRAFTCPIAGHVAQPGKMINAASVALFRGVGRLSAADAEALGLPPHAYVAAGGLWRLTLDGDNVHYLCCESAREAEEWVAAIRSAMGAAPPRFEIELFAEGPSGGAADAAAPPDAFADDARTPPGGAAAGAVHFARGAAADDERPRELGAARVTSVLAPAGPLGLVFAACRWGADERDGHVVAAVKPGSPLAGLVRVGDQLAQVAPLARADDSRLADDAEALSLSLSLSLRSQVAGEPTIHLDHRALSALLVARAGDAEGRELLVVRDPTRTCTPKLTRDGAEGAAARGASTPASRSPAPASDWSAASGSECSASSSACSSDEESRGFTPIAVELDSGKVSPLHDFEGDGEVDVPL